MINNAVLCPPRFCLIWITHVFQYLDLTQSPGLALPTMYVWSVQNPGLACEDSGSFLLQHRLGINEMAKNLSPVLHLLGFLVLVECEGPTSWCFCHCRKWRKFEGRALRKGSPASFVDCLVAWPKPSGSDVEARNLCSSRSLFWTLFPEKWHLEDNKFGSLQKSVYISITCITSSLVLGPDRSPREPCLSHSFPIPTTCSLPSFSWLGATQTVHASVLNIGNFSSSLRRVLLLQGALIWYVEMGYGKKRLLDCTATILSLHVQRGEEEGATEQDRWLFQNHILISINRVKPSICLSVFWNMCHSCYCMLH